MTKPTTHVFLSHAATDRPAARRVAQALEQQGRVRVLTSDMLNIAGEWQEDLRSAIVESDLFAVYLSTQTREAPFVLQEMGAAWAVGKPIVVVLAHPSLQVPLDAAAYETVTAEQLGDSEVVQRVLALGQRTAGADAAA